MARFGYIKARTRVWIIPSDVLSHVDGNPPYSPLAIEGVGCSAGHDYEGAQQLTMLTGQGVFTV